MSEWLAAQVLEKFRCWVDTLDRNSIAGATVHSSSSPVTREGHGFVRRLNHVLKAYSIEQNLGFIGYEV